MLARFAYGYILQGAIVSDNLTLPASNIESSMILFRVGICNFLVTVICDVSAVWAPYIFLKQVNENLYLLNAWFRHVYSGIFDVALLNFILYVKLSAIWLIY